MAGDRPAYVPSSHENGFTLWFTGLSGAGKTTISKLIEGELRGRRNRLEILDGDVIRENLSKGLGFSKEDRDTNIRRIAFVADLLSRNGVPVITAAISPYRETRREARALMGDRFIEVYVNASVETCAARIEALAKLRRRCQTPCVRPSRRTVCVRHLFTV